MFKKMMTCKKTWDKFCEWLKDEYGIICGERYNNKYDLNKIIKDNIPISEIKRIAFYKWFDVIYGIIPDDLILNLMPTFMDEQGIIIQIFYDAEDFYFEVFNYKDKNSNENELFFKTRQEALIKACEKAFNLAERK